MNEHLCEECCVCKEEVELVSGVARPDFQRQIKGVVSSLTRLIWILNEHIFCEVNDSLGVVTQQDPF